MDYELDIFSLLVDLSERQYECDICLISYISLAILLVICALLTALIFIRVRFQYAVRTI